jgi:hypothetical protein
VGLTSGTFVLLIVVVAVAGIAATVVLLPRFRGPVPRQAAIRGGMIVGSQAITLFALLVVFNSSFEFFGSWSDLLGREGNGTVRTVAGHDIPTRRLIPAQVTTDRSANPPRIPAVDGEIRAVTIPGRRTGLYDPAYVYLPPQYTRPAPNVRLRRFPALLILTDSPAQARLAADQLAKVAEAGSTTREDQPTIDVITNLSDALPGGGCIDVPGGRQAETFLAEDVPAAIQTSFRVSAGMGDWGVFGVDSSYCAAKLVLRHSDEFAAAAFPGDPTTAPAGAYYGGSTLITDENSVSWRLANMPAPPVAMLVLTGGGRTAIPGPVRSPLTVTSASVSASDLGPILNWFSGQLSSQQTS